MISISQKIKILWKVGFFYFPKFEKKNRIYYLIIGLAFIRPIGFIFNSPAVDGVGAATCISPLPTVFSSPGGIESFTSRFFVTYPGPNSLPDTVQLTSKCYNKTPFPHPYRNAISLTFGYFPILPDSSAKKILHYMFYQAKVLKYMDVPYSTMYTLINKNETKDGTREWKITISEKQY